MLKVLYQKLRLSSKGNLNHNNYSNLSKLQIRKVGKLHTIGRYIVQGIPVLSIFALVGMVMNAVILLNSSSTAEAVYAAEEVIGDSTASITISGAGSNEQVEAGYGEVSYRAHTVRLQASNAKTHTLIISGPSTLVTKNKDGSIVSGATPTTINSASGVTGTTMASDSSKSNIWGYGWGDTSTSDEDLVYTAPSTTGTALAAGSIDNATHNLDVTKKLAFAIKFSEDALPGRYTDTVTLQLVVTPRVLTTYSITYNANGGDDAPTTQSIESYEDSYSFTIPNAIPTRSGYNFLGWSTSSNASTADSNYAIGKTVTLTVSNPSRVLYAVWQRVYTYSVIYNCNGGSNCPSNFSITSAATSYSHTVKSGTPIKSGYSFLGWSTSSTATSAQYVAGNTVSLTSSSPSLTLYVVWDQYLNWNEITTMQQMKSGTCASASNGATKTLTDTRDNSTYTVRKHSDGNCWMTQNLRIVNKTISSTDSDMTSGSFTIPSSSTSGFSTLNVANVYYGGNTNYGAYYTWYAATAGTGSSSVTSGNASASICPKGWKLPKGGTGAGMNDFALALGLANTVEIASGQNLWSSLSSPSFNNNALTVNNITWPAAGNYDAAASGGSYGVGTHGYYWSRTTMSDRFAHRFQLDRNTAAPASSSVKYYGCSVRCVAYSN